MSTTSSGPEVTTPLPIDRIQEICRKYGVRQLFICGPITGDIASEDDEIEFLVLFLNDDFGPWGSKLDLLENDLSGALHRKVHVASRTGIQHSTPSPWKERILDSARLIYAE